MRTHQKYFSLLQADGSLAPRFVVVTNTEARDGGKTILAGNERVLRARLSDAKFFWDQDHKVKLEAWVPAPRARSEENTSELSSLMRNSIAACCVNKQQHYSPQQTLSPTQP